MRRRTATPVLLAAAAVAATGLTACVDGSQNRWADEIPHDAPSGGQTFAEAEAALGAIPGITLSELRCSEPNIKGNTGCSVDLELEPDHEIADGPGLVTYTAETVWSIREGWMPNTDISISMRAGPDTDVDITAAAHEAGWTEQTRSAQSQPGSEGNPDGWTRVLLPIDTDREDRAQDVRNRERLGDWPGDVPPEPEGLTVPAR